MAETKAKTTKANEEVVKDAAYWNERVKYTIPRDWSTSDKYERVDVNNYTAVIERGKEVEIPRFVADALDNTLAQRYAARDLITDLQNENLPE